MRSDACGVLTLLQPIYLSVQPVIYFIITVQTKVHRIREQILLSSGNKITCSLRDALIFMFSELNLRRSTALTALKNSDLPGIAS